MTNRKSTVQVIADILELEQAKPWLTIEKLEEMERLLAVVPPSEIWVDETGELGLTPLGFVIADAVVEHELAELEDLEVYRQWPGSMPSWSAQL